MASCILWLLSVGVLSYFFYFGMTKTVDNRVEIALTKEQRNMILTEMRQLLKGVQGIIKAVSENDFKQASIIARSNGMVMASEAQNHKELLLKLPLNFKKLGLGIHRGFDELADKAETMRGPEILKETATLMNSCVACHATYKITD